MTNPLRLFEFLRDMYLRYLESPFDLRYIDLAEERRQLLDRDGHIYRYPLIEPISAYQSSSQSFPQVAQATLGNHWQPGEITDAAEFITQGLFPSHLTLYQHQRDVFEEVIVNQVDTVVSTGTGSGKTECFLLPVIASILRESASWTAPGQSPNNWDWWNHFTMQGTRRRWAQRISQREHETRPAAIRALILYPLNALVEDQLARLRDSLDSNGARSWLQSNRQGNRIYFGRYTGQTPVSGERSNANTGRLRDELRSNHQYAQTVENSTAERYFQKMDGAEMWSRWDMQDAPPDILITNYSMLNIMLMRAIEAPMFEQTRQWLASSPDHIFYLVVDELHTYRGTPGTEVAYLLRALLDRLGLSPGSGQLRIISSSASLDSGSSGLEYLEQFFGRDRGRFRIIGGPAYIVQPDPNSPASISGHALAFAQFAQDLNVGGLNSLMQATSSLHAAVSTPLIPASASAETILCSILQHIQAPDALRQVCTINHQIVPHTPTQLAQNLFPSIPILQAEMAVDGLLTALCFALNDTGNALLPLRVHLMFRNLQGLWVCTDPNCNQAPHRSEVCPGGDLYYIPSLTCQCGSRILELLYCEACGEVFFGGYRRPKVSEPLNPNIGINPGEWYLSPDHPDLEASPDFASFDRDYDSYAVFWPTESLTPASAQWDQKHIRRQWMQANLDPTDGKIAIGVPQGNEIPGYLYYVPSVHRINSQQDPADIEAYPSICPRCDADWRRREVISSPIRTQRTGFQKIAQVLADGLLRDLSQPPLSTERKLVVFSDSRQDAAKLSAGMRLSHYRDSLRQALMTAVERQAVGPQAYDAYCQNQVLSPEQRQAAIKFRSEHSNDANIISMAVNLPSEPLLENPAITYQQAAQLILHRAANGPYHITQIANSVSSCLLAEGMNPAGYSMEALWTDSRYHHGSWCHLYTWPQNNQPLEKDVGHLTEPQRDHRTRIQTRAVVELMDIIFASGRRSVESLLLFLPTTDRISNPAVTDLVQEGVDGTIRLLGSRKRLSIHEFYPQNSVPGYIIGYLTAIAQHNGLSSNNFIDDVIGHLSGTGCLNTTGYYLNVNSLFIQPAGATYYECTQCRRIHLHPSGGICTECWSPLSTPQSTSAAQLSLDYYGFLATQAGNIFRLNCEELTGQTNKSDARKRQRLFQNICLPSPEENPLSDPVDLLSVTTTLEAGVDIGTLVAIMMANMPPMRFNYQQRVGRAGRRGTAMSVALTLCRGRSHDDYYFQRPQRITSDPPPQPYVDMRRKSIIQRVIAKEVLRQAFNSLDLFQGGGSDNVHGEFGTAANWNQVPPQPPPGSPPNSTTAQIVAEWINQNNTEITRIVDVLLQYTELQAHRQSLIDYCLNQLIPQVTQFSNNPRYTQEKLSERLANAGILPMFGFPTRTRYLYHEQPTNAYPWPPDYVVDRELDLAISQFAPGAETVKDGIIHTSVGVVDYRPQSGRVIEGPDPLGTPIPVGICSACHAIDDNYPPAASCLVCGSTSQQNPGYSITNLSQPAGFRTYYGRSRDFEGTFEWTPRASRPKMGFRQLPMIQRANFEVWADQDTVFIINDNGGQLFEFVRLMQGQTWVTQAALDSVVAPPPRVDTSVTDLRALSSVNPTDVMVLGIIDWPIGILTSPAGSEGLGVRAALYSFGFLIRRAATVLLDIQDREIKVGLRSIQNPAGSIIGQIFLSDTLENGAGYASYLGQPNETENLLRFILGLGSSTFYGFLVGPEHAGSNLSGCTTSCPDCLRDFTNLAYHNILDWRLGLDLARLALDPAAPIDFSVPYWQGLDAAVAGPYFTAMGYQQITYGGLQAGRRGTKAQIITHPLWDCNPDNFGPQLASAYAQAIGDGCTEVSYKSIFEVLRRPF